MRTETVLSSSLKRLVAMGMVVLLLIPAEGELFAQQGPAPDPQYANPQSGNSPYPQNEYPQNAPYSGQNLPNQQYRYGQPANSRQQQYGRPYPEQSYPQQQAGLQTDQNYAGPGEDPGYGPGSEYEQSQAQAQPLSAEQLQQLVAPIALYPDALIAQVLAASTYPAQVAAADQWLRALGNVSPDQIAAGANAQSWDPSVKALTAFPQVLGQMDQDLRWTTDLGNAYYNQPQDVLQTVQIMRQRAQAAGNLQSTPQEQVTEDQGYIQVAPVNPQVVYVPMYNPWYVYGQPVAPYPGFSLFGALASFAGSAFVQFGPGMALAAFSATPFGWGFWALNWLGHAIFFNHAAYYSHSTSIAHWGYGRGGSYGYSRGSSYGYARGNGDRGGYNRSQYNQGSYNRGGSSYGRTGNGYRGQTYASNRGYGEDRAYGNQSFDANRGFEANRGYTAPQGNAVRPAFQNYAYNRPQAAMPARQQSYARPGGYGYGSYGNGGQSYAARPGAAYASPQRSELSQRAYAGYGGDNRGSSFGGRGFRQSAPKAERSGGGFHMFGGGHNSEKSFGGGHAPKSSGGGHGGGGGHSSHHR